MNGSVVPETNSPLNDLKSQDPSEMESVGLDVKNGKAPRRVLHFSDGTLEEYSSDEDEADLPYTAEVSTIDPKQLEWGPWLWYKASAAGSRTLEVCDYLGESLADFFGITTPKYQYEIEEYHRMVAEEKEAQKKMDLEMGGWSTPVDLELEPVKEQQNAIPERFWTHGQQGSSV